MSTREAATFGGRESGASVAAAQAVNRSYIEKLPRRLWGSVKLATGFFSMAAGLGLLTAEHVSGLNFGAGLALTAFGADFAVNGLLEAATGEQQPHIVEHFFKKKNK